MLIDIFYVLLTLFGFFRGLKRGIVRSLFAFLAFWIGLVAAIKLSLLFSKLLSSFNILNEKWLAFFSFILIFLLFSLLIKKMGALIDKKIKSTAPAFLNSIGGGISYFMIYTLIFTVLLIYLYNVNVIDFNMLNVSKTYNIICPKAFKMLNRLSNFIPIFRNIFA